jgi:hypothetical protein
MSTRRTEEERQKGSVGKVMMCALTVKTVGMLAMRGELLELLEAVRVSSLEMPIAIDIAASSCPG